MVEQTQNCPELLTDWGNAALGASNLGVAAFAYNEALDIQPRLLRAKQNASWIEAQLPDWAQSKSISLIHYYGENGSLE